MLLHEYVLYKVITLPYYAITLLHDSLRMFFYTLLPCYAVTHVFCRCVFHFLYIVTSLCSFSMLLPSHAMDLFSFPLFCVLTCYGVSLLDYFRPFLLCMPLVFCIVVFSGELNISKRYRPHVVNNGPGIRWANHITLLQVISRKTEKRFLKCASLVKLIDLSCGIS